MSFISKWIKLSAIFLQVPPSIVITNPEIKENTKYNIPCSWHTDYFQEFTFHIPLSKIDKTSNSVDLLNAREVIPLVETLRNEFNININEGMAVVHNNDFYFAGEALHFLGTHSSKKYFFSNLINIIYKNKFISIKLYPLFKFFRSILLKLLRRKPL